MLTLRNQGPHSNLNTIWLVVSTPLKNISQNGNLPQIVVKITNFWNHHLAIFCRFPPMKGQDGWTKGDSLSKKYSKGKIIPGKMLVPLRWYPEITPPKKTLYSGYLLGIIPFKGLILAGFSIRDPTWSPNAEGQQQPLISGHVFTIPKKVTENCQVGTGV